MGYFDYFTPYHTNSVNVFVSMLCHLGVVVGPAAMFGILATGHTIYPKKFSELMAMNVMGFGKSQSAIASSLGKLGSIAVVPTGLMFASMTLMDQLNMLSLAPGVFWTGLSTTLIYYKSRELVTPLWFAR